MATFTLQDSRLRAKLAAYSRWARTSDSAAATAPARAAFNARFEREVDPAGALPAAERARRADAARKAYFALAPAPPAAVTLPRP